MVNLEQHTLPVLLQEATQAYRKLPALSRVIDGSVQQIYDYEALAAASGRFAKLLGTLGVAAGDRVLILCENRPEWAVAYFGIALEIGRASCRERV